MATESIPQGTVKEPPVERAMDVTGRPITENVAHRGDPLGVGMGYHGPNFKKGNRHKRHRPVRDHVEGGGGADRNSPPHQPVDAHHTL